MAVRPRAVPVKTVPVGTDQTYAITIDDGGRKHTVVFSDPATPAVKTLVDRLRALTSRSPR